MYVRADPLPDPPPTKALKVNLPVDLHLKLHALRVLRGDSISSVVAQALRAHFAVLEAADDDMAKALDRARTVFHIRDVGDDD